MTHPELDFSEPARKELSSEDARAIAAWLMSPRGRIPEWYTDSAIRLNYRVESETASRCGILLPDFKEYERQVKAGERRLFMQKGVLNEPA